MHRLVELEHRLGRGGQRVKARGRVNGVLPGWTPARGRDPRGPQRLAEMLKHAADRGRLGDQGHDTHLGAAVRTDEGKYCVAPSQEHCPEVAGRGVVAPDGVRLERGLFSGRTTRRLGRLGSELGPRQGEWGARTPW